MQGNIVVKWRAYSYWLEDWGMVLSKDLQLQFSNGRHGAGYESLPNHCGINNSDPVALGQWSHVVGTIDAEGNGTLRLNGFLQAQNNILPLLASAAEPVRIGQMLCNFAGDGASAPVNDPDLTKLQDALPKQ